MLQQNALLPNLWSTDLKAKLRTSDLVLSQSGHSRRLLKPLVSQFFFELVSSAALSCHRHLLGQFQRHRDRARQHCQCSHQGHPADARIYHFKSFIYTRHPFFCEVLFTSYARTTGWVVESCCCYGRKQHLYVQEPIRLALPISAPNQKHVFYPQQNLLQEDSNCIIREVLTCPASTRPQKSRAFKEAVLIVHRSCGWIG